MTEEQIGLAGLVVGAAGVLIGIFAWLVPQWRSESVRVRQAVRDARPDIYFHVSSISGPGGSGYSVIIKNEGRPQALEAVVRLPSAEEPALRPGTIHERFEKSFSVPLVGTASIRTTLMPDAEAVLEYEDALGLLHRQVVPVTQTKRDDGQYNFGGDQKRTRVERPTIGAREIWRLRNLA